MADQLDDSLVSEAIASLSFGSPCDHTHRVRKVMIRAVGLGNIDLWHAIDVMDFSTFRSFVVLSEGYMYDVDFLSRHEIVPPMAVSKLPPGWESWAVVHGNQLIITNKSEFCCRMMTADAAVALPTYRFEFLFDDVQSALASGCDTISEALESTLKSVLTGYSYKKFWIALPVTDPVKVFSLRFVN